MKNNALIFCLIISVCACTGSNQNSSDTHQEEIHNHADGGHHSHGDHRAFEVMAIHDSIMPKMQDLFNLKKQLVARIAKADSANGKGANTLAKAEKQEAEAIKSRLEQADESMMDWMRNYNADTLDLLDAEKAADYLAEQKRKIIDVRDRMTSVQRDAEKFLQKDKQ
jgi:hypothetical protein